MEVNQTSQGLNDDNSTSEIDSEIRDMWNLDPPNEKQDLKITQSIRHRMDDLI